MVVQCPTQCGLKVHQDYYPVPMSENAVAKPHLEVELWGHPAASQRDLSGGGVNRLSLNRSQEIWDEAGDDVGKVRCRQCAGPGRGREDCEFTGQALTLWSLGREAELRCRAGLFVWLEKEIIITRQLLQTDFTLSVNFESRRVGRACSVSAHLDRLKSGRLVNGSRYFPVRGLCRKRIGYAHRFGLWACG